MSILIKRYGLLIILPFLLSCAEFMTPVPESYLGPRALLSDSMTRRGSGYDIFYVSKFNGEEIKQSLRSTQSASYGHGMSVIPVTVDREVPIASAKFTIMGRTYYAAPI